MASSEDWAPLPQRKGNKKGRENHNKIFSQLMEMFGSTFESDIVKSVAETCNWKLEQTIETLITLTSESYPTSNESSSFEAEESKTSSGKKSPPSSQPSNSAFLDSQTPAYDPWAADDFPDAAIEADWSLPLEAKDPTKEVPKVETASLCGLKVEYRPRGMDTNSDDDADVVIEESSGTSSRAVSPETVSVCQFLASPTQCPPRTTFPRTVCSSTHSPPVTPQRTPSLTTGLAHIEAEIREGFRVLVLMRGAPGSGKSYLARSILERTVPGARVSEHIFSTDDYFVLINRGVYVFDHARLSEAHEFNQNRVMRAMRDGLSPIFVDNTNTQVWEMQQYATMGVQHGYIVETVEPETPWARNVNDLDKRNKHKVPKAKIRLMLERYESNISGEELVRILKLKYSSDNQPPQLRRQPPLPAMLTSSPVNIAPSPKRRPRKPRKLDTPQKLIDNDALNTIAKEYANMDDKVKLNTHDSWTEGISYKEDSLLDLMKLGAIGSERKSVTPKASDNDEDFKQEQSEQIEADSKTQGTKQDNEKQEASLLLDVDVNDKVEVCVEISNSKDLISCENKNVISEIMEPVKVEATAKIEGTGDKKIIISEIIEPVKVEATANIEDICGNKNTMSEIMEPVTVKATAKIEDTCEKKIIISETIEPVKVEVTTKIEDTKEIKEEENVSIEKNDIADTAINSTEHNESKSTEESPQEIIEPEKESFPLSEKSSSHSSFEHSSDLDISQYEICNNSEGDTDLSAHKKTDTSDDKHSTGGLSSLFSFINSFLVVDKEKSQSSVPESHSSDSSNTEISTSAEKIDLEAVTNLLDSSAETNDEFFEARDNDLTDLVKEQLLEASSDFQLVEQHEDKECKIAKEESKICNIISDEAILEDIYKKFEFDLRKVSEEISKENILDNKNVFAEKLDSRILNPDGIDNVNLISWRESPFPVDEATSDKLQISEIESVKLETLEKETNTHPYDFNVAFVGGTDEYKVLNAFNRNINCDRSSPTDDKIPPQGKLLLHKGTMTTATSILSDNGLFDLEVEAELEDRGDELIELFCQLPRHYVLYVYRNLCKRNLDWTVDYLTNLQYDDPLCAIIDQFDQPPADQDQESVDLLTRTSSESSSSAETAQQKSEQQSQQTRTSRRKKLPSPFELALQRQLQEKFVLSEESYRPHTLRVKRWKKREFSPPEKQNQSQPVLPVPTTVVLPDTFQVHSTEHVSNEIAKETKRPTRLDHPAVEEQPAEEEEEESYEEETEEEEMMELKLGYEFISVLESEFGNSGFQVPDGLFPVIQIRRSMAQELHALWIESMQRQLWVMQEQLDEMIAKDAEYAKSLEAAEEAEEEKEEARALPDNEVSNLREVLDMEIALAKCSNKQSTKWERYLRDMFPEYDRETLRELYEAHNRNFDETVNILRENSVHKPTMADVLKKRNDLFDKLKNQTTENRTNENHNQDGLYEEDNDDEDYMTYEDAMKHAHESREEASRQYNLRNENYRKAAEACRLKRSQVAAYYSDVAKIHVKQMETANAKAAAAILAAQACTHENDDKVDLHKLRVVEAIQVLDIFVDDRLNEMSKGERKTIYIITGRGLHSPSGYSRIKSKVAERLNQKNFIFEEINPGMLKVILRKK